ncbi:hypothetical protein [Alicyclobacillus acidoterrestris]|uniref:Uncharacterized protein n=1 Tax=Alicyclobacillus acidoterrestris (strain ATCC 49025 / DSM 3922 / CIP 106132 / NCIMB 13137 / GD3B) TaxID=1356854 RepID=T0CA04_ALIAG|nr:hypothetical protein [Alicyclobacillus acidoterrestris]EPZ52968.1 hypothetical protein N007_18915 [Alicyclobacillus acidoterrestris ATCC 49025]UNO50027.1 hypothetical protein K1I37_05910 [Alicyclobacillus acidoterrestris]GEO25267.1 hypothetical protein AAC03nite_10520 [Alicyclobacillus acidoterrestris]
MRKKRKWGRLFLGFVVVLTIFQVLYLNHYNTLFKSEQAGTAQAIQDILDEPVTLSAAEKARIQQLKSTYQGVTVSPGGQYVTYVDTASDGSYVVHVEDLDTGKQVSEAGDLYPVQYLCWLGDEEIFVGEQKAPGDLELNTFYISNGQQADVTAASVPEFTALASDAAITKVTYSQQTNDVFVLVNTSTSSALYHIGTMENVQSVPFSDGYIKNIALSQTGDHLYAEVNQGGTWDVVRLDQSSTTTSTSPEYDVNSQIVQSDAALINVIGNVLYYGKINQDGLVTAVYRQDTNGESTLIKTLSTPTMASHIIISGDGQVTVNPLAASDTVVGS